VISYRLSLSKLMSSRLNCRHNRSPSGGLHSSILVRLWRDQGKVREARELLAPVYGWFTEEFDTRDLKEAKALLKRLVS
jgi:predicted ATPase